MASVKPHGKQYRYFTVDVGSDLPEADSADLEILGEEIIDFIIERTLSGKNVMNRQFGRYSKAYAEREGKDNPPDLNLSSEMLESLEVLEVMPRAKRIKIGYTDSDQALLGKVEGNIRGTYGKPKPLPGKARDFLGISAKDLNEIVKLVFIMALSVNKQMTRFTKLLRKVIDDTASKEVMKEVGEQTLRLVQQQAKLGNDYKTGGKFKPLSDPYKGKRKKYKSELHERTRPQKSNVTATGQMIDSLKVSEIRARSVVIEASGNRRKSSFGGSRDNAEVAYYVEKNGRHFLGLADKTRTRLQRFYKRIVNGVVKRNKINK